MSFGGVPLRCKPLYSSVCVDHNEFAFYPVPANLRHNRERAKGVREEVCQRLIMTHGCTGGNLGVCIDRSPSFPPHPASAMGAEAHHHRPTLKQVRKLRLSGLFFGPLSCR